MLILDLLLVQLQIRIITKSSYKKQEVLRENLLEHNYRQLTKMTLIRIRLMIGILDCINR